MFYLTTLSTHFIYSYMVKDHSDSKKGNLLPPHGLVFPISSKGSFIYASSHRQNNTYHSLCYTSRGALAGTRTVQKVPTFLCVDAFPRFRCNNCRQLSTQIWQPVIRWIIIWKDKPNLCMSPNHNSNNIMCTKSIRWHYKQQTVLLRQWARFFACSNRLKNLSTEIFCIKLIEIKYMETDLQPASL